MCDRRRRLAGSSGYAMAALLVGIAIISVVTSVALPSWRTLVKREKEEELIFRGRQYVRAIELYQRKFANAYPPSLDLLVQQRFLRKKYKDPMTKEGEFQLLYQTMAAIPGRGGMPGGGRGRGVGVGGGSTGRVGEATEETDTGGQPPSGGAPSTFGGQPAGPRGGIVGVASKSTEESMRTYNGRTHYNEWQFVLSQTGPAGRGSAVPGVAPGQPIPGRGGQQMPPRGLGSPIRPPGR